MISKTQLWKLLIASAVIGIAFYVALYGPHSLFLLSGIVLALALFWVRSRHRMLYGLIEIIARPKTL
jgi:hypothetical protein